jgi:GGDEF domain-containing protein
LEAAELQILWVVLQPGAEPSLDAGLCASPFGRVALTRCASLGEASSVLGDRNFDGVLISLGSGDFAQLPAWTGLAQAVPEMAVVVLVSGAFDAAVATRLVHAGVQDVLGGPQLGNSEAALADAARSLHLSIDASGSNASARASATDLRTGLPDRQQLIDHMSQLLALRGREPASMALLALRVEGFETVEASLGGESANVLRRKVAVRLRGAVRASDVVAALTADSFALLLASTEEPIDAELVAHKLLRALPDLHDRRPASRRRDEHRHQPLSVRRQRCGRVAAPGGRRRGSRRRAGARRIRQLARKPVARHRRRERWRGRRALTARRGGAAAIATCRCRPASTHLDVVIDAVA